MSAAKAIIDGTYRGGSHLGTLENGGVGIASFHNLDALVSSKVKSDLEQIKADIIAGKIKISPENRIQKDQEMGDDKILGFLEAYGTALSNGDLPTVSSCWAVPAWVLSDQGAIAVTYASEIEAFFAQGVEYYRSQGIMSTKPELERVEMLSDALVSVDVRWPAYYSSGTEKSSERSHYILLMGGDDQILIRVALTRSVELSTLTS